MNGLFRAVAALSLGLDDKDGREVVCCVGRIVKWSGLELVLGLGALRRWNGEQEVSGGTFDHSQSCMRTRLS